MIVTEVYAAREKAEDFDNLLCRPGGGQHAPSRHARFIPALEDISDYLLQQLQPGDVLLVLSAGDADQISARVLSGLRERNGSTCLKPERPNGVLNLRLYLRWKGVQISPVSRMSNPARKERARQSG